MKIKYEVGESYLRGHRTNFEAECIHHDFPVQWLTCRHFAHERKGSGCKDCWQHPVSVKEENTKNLPNSLSSAESEIYTKSLTPVGPVSVPSHSTLEEVLSRCMLVNILSVHTYISTDGRISRIRTVESRSSVGWNVSFFLQTSIKLPKVASGLRDAIYTFNNKPTNKKRKVYKDSLVGYKPKLL